jgi:thiamine-phosphate pyrophosphorylase
MPHLLLVTDVIRLPNPDAAILALPRGIRARFRPRFKAGVIVRERTPAALEILARRITPLCRARGIAIIIANDVRLALKLGADGVHLSEDMARRGLLSCHRVLRRNRKRGLIVTVAVHSERALRRALSLNIDGALIAPVFATKSHPEVSPIGAVRLAALINKMKHRHRSTSLIALGGVTPATAHRLIACGVDGFAAIGALT